MLRGRSDAGSGGATSAPAPKESVQEILSLTDGSTGRTVFVIPQPTIPANLVYLLQATAYIAGDHLDGPTHAGPVWCQIWAQRPGASGPELLDEGYLRRAFARGLKSIVGVRCHISLPAGTEIQAEFSNDSGGTLSVDFRIWTHEHLPHAVPETLVHLSTSKTAMWEFNGTVPETAAGGGDHSLTVTPGLGDEFFFLHGAIFNDDAAARNLTAEIRNVDAEPIYSFLSNTFAVLSVAANTRQQYPNNANPGTAWGDDAPIRNPYNIVAILAAVANTFTTEFWATGLVKGRKPTATLASTGTATPTTTYNRLR